jgi:hypothetical protein
MSSFFFDVGMTQVLRWSAEDDAVVWIVSLSVFVKPTNRKWEEMTYYAEGYWREHYVGVSCGSAMPSVVGGRRRMNTSLEVSLLLSLLHRTDLEAKDGWRDHDNERERHMEEPPGAADKPVLLVVIAVTMGEEAPLGSPPACGGLDKGA